MTDSVHIRGRDPLSLLRYEASRNPDLANLCEKAGILEDSDIDCLPYRLWIRNALKQLARQSRVAKVSESVSETVAAHVVDGVTPDLPGVVYEYTGEPIFVSTRNSGQIQVPTGKLFLLMDAPEHNAVEVNVMFHPSFGDEGHRLWVETVSCRSDTRLINSCVRVQAATKSEYRALLQQRLQRLYPNAPQTVCVGAPEAEAQPLAHLGVRIQR